MTYSIFEIVIMSFGWIIVGFALGLLASERRLRLYRKLIDKIIERNNEND